MFFVFFSQERIWRLGRFLFLLPQFLCLQIWRYADVNGGSQMLSDVVWVLLMVDRVTCWDWKIELWDKLRGEYYLIVCVRPILWSEKCRKYQRSLQIRMMLRVVQVLLVSCHLWVSRTLGWQSRSVDHHYQVRWNELFGMVSINKHVYWWKDKLDYVNGHILEPDALDTQTYDKWESENLIVMSWLLNSM